MQYKSTEMEQSAPKELESKVNSEKKHFLIRVNARNPKAQRKQNNVLVQKFGVSSTNCNEILKSKT